MHQTGFIDAFQRLGSQSGMDLDGGINHCTADLVKVHQLRVLRILYGFKERSRPVCDVGHMIKEMRHKERLCVLRVLCG